GRRTVALKMILRAEHASGQERLRFQREAEALGKLRHENIVQVYEVGEYQGSPFYSLEFVDGGSLHQYLGGKPMPPRQAAQMVEVLARAMHAAHEVGLVHRDLKPANILLQGRTGGASASSAVPSTANGPSSAGSAGASAGGDLPHPKITDFGLVKDVKESGQTRSGELLGTPSYMAPEQASGQVHQVDARTDVWALGAILYECLTGRPPFRAATVMDTLGEVLNSEPASPRRSACERGEKQNRPTRQERESGGRRRKRSRRGTAPRERRVAHGKQKGGRSSGRRRRSERRSGPRRRCT